MISQNANRIADGCRFCWMCRHICPTGIATGREEFTPRARGLIISMLARGMQMDEDLAESMFTCALCGSCSNDCVTGYEPPVFIREGRTEAIVQDMIPQEVAPVIERALNGEDIVEAVECEKRAALLEKLSSLPETAPYAVVLGQTACNRVPDMALNLLSVLDKAGIAYTVIRKDTGAMLYDLVGDVEEVRSQAAAFAAEAEKTGAKNLIVLDPLDARALIQCYPEWEIDVQAKAATAVAFLDDLITSERLSVTKAQTEGVLTLQDPDVLARDLDDTDSARDILSALGTEYREMFLNRRLARSAGSALLVSYHADITGEMTRIRVDDAKRTGADAIIAAAPCDLMLLRENGDIRVLDLFGLIDASIL